MPGSAIEPFVFRHPVSALSHLLWCLWAVYAAALLWRLARPECRRSLAVFGAGMALLYAASGVYHSIPADYPRLVTTFRRFDLAAIHLLIAATCTPLFAA